MYEAAAMNAIKKGEVYINNKKFLIKKEPHGSCDGCYFSGKKTCPQIALDICCTGGNILKLDAGIDILTLL